MQALTALSSKCGVKCISSLVEMQAIYKVVQFLASQAGCVFVCVCVCVCVCVRTTAHVYIIYFHVG